MLFTAYCLLSTVYCLLPTVHCPSGGDRCARFGLVEMEEIGLVETLNHAVERNSRTLPHCSMLVLSRLSTGVMVDDIFLHRLLDTIKILQTGLDGAADFAQSTSPWPWTTFSSPEIRYCAASDANPRCCRHLGSQGKVRAGSCRWRRGPCPPSPVP